MKNLVIAAAQTIPVRGNITKNLEDHYKLIDKSYEYYVDLIVFPELSITGYEPDLAEELAFTPNDKRLTILSELSFQKNVIIIAGGPVRLETGLHIGSFIFLPDNSSFIYTKHYLHPGEEKYFVPGKLNPSITLDDEIISLAICADIANPLHPEDAYKAGCTLYLSSVLITDKGYEDDVTLLKKYAEKYSMTVLMANYGYDSGGYHAGGRSVILSNKGSIITEFEGLGEGLIISENVNGNWIKKL